MPPSDLSGSSQSWDDIRFFLAVAELGSWNAAAKRLGLVHTTVARRIQAIEAKFHVDLFKREGNLLALTADGILVYAEAQRMDEAAAQFSRKLKGAEGRMAGDVRFWITEGLAAFWMLPRIQPFRAANPLLNIIFATNNRITGKLGVDYDIALSWVRPDDSSAIIQKLGTVKYSMYADQTYADKRGLPASIKDFHKHKFATFNGYEDNPGLRKWNDMVRKQQNVLWMENTAASHAVLISNEVITLLPDYASIIYPGLAKVPVDLGIALEIWLVYHADHKGNAKIKAVHDEVKTLFAKDKGVWFS
jgi:DNA-binding transcriptional LysR family regulator